MASNQILMEYDQCEYRSVIAIIAFTIFANGPGTSIMHLVIKILAHDKVGPSRTAVTCDKKSNTVHFLLLIACYEVMW